MSGFSEYDQYDGLGLAELVRRQQVKPSELVEAAISRIEQVNGAGIRRQPRRRSYPVPVGGGSGLRPPQVPREPDPGSRADQQKARTGRYLAATGSPYSVPRPCVPT